ncbi:methyltransferase domain-containing protein [Parasphingorhabdus flavimaris]|uniref:Methyltransferase domain-containing protein n=1 Tax=Parasphingorhabdus flavimaris TaxID=266812 RepID=A0ABX2N403_9SPHN|nr:CheR family methyltransferase [Parasphingorhabdus flavimaris]NVD28417.1 methyltransferase domain-containing protein [Parasphingorhabdus flavimaris]|tara:strand:+ start:18358 stop:19209 length:852 start_codon:yes stop_codon:yes gene_type:complete
MDMNFGSQKIIADLLAARTGQQLTEDRSWRIGTALSGIFRQIGISNVDQLVCLLDQPSHATLSQQVVEALLNNETYFFRDRAMFNQLSDLVLPQIAKERRQERTLSILCAGCSTGQEALSLGMVLLEQKARWAGWKIEITGIDISHGAIATARAGTYSQFEIQRGLPVAQMLAHFTETPIGWEANEELRSLVRFRVHNLLDPMPAIGPFDLILCRNVLLYFDAATRRRAFSRLMESVNPEGWVMLGAGETIVGHTDQLALVKGGIGLYRPTGSRLEANFMKRA